MDIKLLDTVLRHAGHLKDEDVLTRVGEIVSDRINGTMLTYWTDVCQYSINTYELTGLIKDWIFDCRIGRHYIDVLSGVQHGISSGRKMFNCILISWCIKENNSPRKTFESETEFGAVVLAAEWVFKRVGEEK